MNNPKLNRCLFCGSSDVEVGYSEYRANSPVWVTCNECQADGPYIGTNATEKGVAKAWNEPYVAKALETLEKHLRNGHYIYCSSEIANPSVRLHPKSLSGYDSQPIATGETMLDMVMDLQDKVTK